MHPHISQVLIGTFANNDSIIYDPYCGSGTVLVEAILNGNCSVGADLNPLACLLSKVKTTPIEPEALQNILPKVQSDLRKTGKRSFVSELDFIPEDVNLYYWFKTTTVQKLSVIHHLIRSEWLDFGTDIHDLLRLCFARLVREVSTVRKGEFKLYRLPAADIVYYSPHVLARFEEIIQEAIERMRQLTYIISHSKVDWQRPRIHNESNHLIRLGRKADLVITSPPYGDNPTTISYGQFSRYPLLWLGYPRTLAYSLDKNPEVRDTSDMAQLLWENSRTYQLTLTTIRRKNPTRAIAIEAYFLGLARSLMRISDNMNQEGKLCLVIGSRTVCHLTIDNQRIAGELANSLGLHSLTNIERVISFKRLPIRNATGQTISKETVMILEKK